MSVAIWPCPARWRRRTTTAIPMRPAVRRIVVHAHSRTPCSEAPSTAPAATPRADDEDGGERRGGDDPREVLERVRAQPRVVEAADLEVHEGQDDEEHRPREAPAGDVAVVQPGGRDADAEHPDVDEEAAAHPRAGGHRADARAQRRVVMPERDRSRPRGTCSGVRTRSVPPTVRRGLSLRLPWRRRKALTRACIRARVVAHRPDLRQAGRRPQAPEEEPPQWSGSRRAGFGFEGMRLSSPRPDARSRSRARWATPGRQSLRRGRHGAARRRPPDASSGTANAEARAQEARAVPAGDVPPRARGERPSRRRGRWRRRSPPRARAAGRWPPSR